MNSNQQTVSTLWRKWCQNADESPNSEAIVHWKAGEAPYRWTRSALIRSAKAYSAVLAGGGIKKGDVCAIICRHSPFFYPVYLGCVSIGAIPAVLAYPNPRLHPDKFREGLEGMSRR